MQAVQEIDLMEIDPWKLPWVAIEDRELLPESNGIYFVIKGRRVLYIGKTENGFKTRWNGHHRYNQLKAYSDVRIAYWEAAEIDYLAIEAELIYLFNPEFNRTPVTKDELRIKYEQTVLALEKQKAKAVVDRTSRKLISLCGDISSDMMYLNALAKISDPEHPGDTGIKMNDFGKSLNEVGENLNRAVKEYTELRDAVRNYYRAIQEFKM